MKFAALILIAAAPTVFGYWWGEKKREKRKAASSFLRFLRAIRSELSFSLRPAPEIFRSFRDPFLEKKGFLPKLREESAREAPGALARTADSLLSSLVTGERLLEILSAYCARFGTLPKDLQLQETENAIACLEEKEKEYLAKEDADVRLARTIGCAVGVGLLILLL